MEDDKEKRAAKIEKDKSKQRRQQQVKKVNFNKKKVSYRKIGVKLDEEGKNDNG